MVDWRTMRNTVLVLVLTFLSLSEGRSRRVKRDLFQLAEMIKYVTDKDPLNFNGYGCYCGWGGSGAPVDKADGCCKVHDDCYGSITNDLKDCTPKWTHYKWNISNKSIDCLNEATKLDNIKGLLYDPKSCPRRICECDKALVECLYKNQYHPKNYKLDKGLKCKDNTGM